ncbi:MAG: glycosyltransferase family 4 protein [Actinobacteria bacterium]|nr:glycosyltransferase family 4 protein [Actinomycetota bacterium]
MPDDLTRSTGAAGAGPGGAKGFDPDDTVLDLNEVAARAHRVGLEHIHVLAWRDLDDVEAGGSEVYVDRIASRWGAAGLDVLVRTSYAQGHRPAGEHDGYRVVRRAGRNMVFPMTITEELLRSHGPIDGMLEVWNGVPYLSPLWFTGPKAVLMHHVHRDMWNLVLESEKLAKIGETVETKLAPLFYRRTQMITDSRSSRAEMVTQLGLDEERIAIAPPGIDERFTPKGPKSPFPLVVAVGRLMPAKRFDELVHLCAQARESIVDLQLVIVGDGYEYDNLSRLVSELSAEGWVRLAGRATDEEVVDLYRSAWVVASASIAEGWGMSLTEAAACGTPTVARHIPGHIDAVADGTSGVLCETTDGMCEQLEAILSDGLLRARLSAGAIEHAATLTWDATAATILDCLVRQAEAKRSRRR